jgi:hypothetical protein
MLVLGDVDQGSMTRLKGLELKAQVIGKGDISSKTAHKTGISLGIIWIVFYDECGGMFDH